MEKNRLILATVLSFLILIGWSYFFSPKEQPKPAPSAQQQESAATVQPQAAPSAADEGAGRALPTMAAAISQGRTVTVDTPLYTARLNTHGGLLESFVLKQYRQTIEPGSPSVELVSPQAMLKAPLGLIWSGQATWSAPDWTFEGGDLALSDGQTGTLTFACDLSGLHLTRTLTFSAGSYLIKEAVQLTPAAGQATSGRLDFTLASTGLSSEKDHYNPTRMEWLQKGSLEQEKSAKDMAKGVYSDEELGWGGLASNYFMLDLVPQSPGAVFKGKLDDGIYRMAVERGGITLPAGSSATVNMAYYLGPKDPKVLATADHGLDKAVNFGFFNVIAKPLLWLLNIFHTWVGNWGVAIIILTALIKIVFWPLSQKSYVSMNKMKKLQPMMAKIREKYGKDREKMNQELMQLYKTYKVNPMGGCLPMVLQIPVFFGLYEALLQSIQLRHAPFITHLPFTNLIWLADLSAKDPYYITPLIMGATMFLQQKMSPPPGDPTQAKIMLFMPVVFTGLFLNFPAGLVVYWLVNNVLSISQQWLLMRKS
ncbi:Membrane protein oxaA [Desulfovibrio sp. X2]|uniref:membrane protein insertase YidC n=1 Tax=Desulfovibrio sp. X2 TaxID=941449 RepID=UPI0003588750|nr:membrane protein insertase YidC [Desulfovibrio sp. X2]EPR40238.1 Membrane protein oxaA [Desulfovibrio sp. X2]